MVYGFVCAKNKVFGKLPIAPVTCPRLGGIFSQGFLNSWQLSDRIRFCLRCKLKYNVCELKDSVEVGWVWAAAGNR
jgi:hypothetical protein